MKLKLNSSYKSNKNILDFAIDPLNENMITTGDYLNYIKNNKIIKSLKNKYLKHTLNLRFIKYDNELFQSNDFYVINSEFNLFKVDGKKKKIISKIPLNVKNIEILNINSTEKVIYIANNILYVFDIKNNTLKSFPLKDLGKGIYKLYISGENIVLKHRKTYENSNTIMIFNLSNLKMFSRINSITNHIYFKIVGLNYLASTEDGEIELWDILESEIKNSFKLSDYKITFIEELNKIYYFGDVKGNLIITDKEFNIIKKEKIFKTSIKRIVVFNSKIYVLSEENEFKIFEIINKEEILKLKNKFFDVFKIHKSYIDFFEEDIILKIYNFLKELKLKNIEYTPKYENIFKAFNLDIKDLKVCIIGKDPYFQKDVATGLSFEVKSLSWFDEKVNTSLKNILKLIYKSYTGKYADIFEIRESIKKEEFKILSPNKLFESWKKQGVFLLNSSLTTEVGIAGKHHYFWKDITSKLLTYISSKNPNITFLLWGNDAIILEKYIKNGKIIKHNHPAICGNLKNNSDFMLGKSFEETKDKINWLG